MAAAAQALYEDSPHIPVLLRPLIEVLSPVSGAWVDGTFGAGGYARALLEAGAERVIGIDRDPLALDMAANWIGEYGDRLTLHSGRFSNMEDFAGSVDGVVLDLGVSSMQLDRSERGFSFVRDGPLDMRMSQEGTSAAELIASASEGQLADILYHFGEERASRRIARAIGKKRDEVPIVTTAQLADIISNVLPRPKPGQSHPATRSFQALRIAVNNEFDELVDGLEAAERILKQGGTLAVVSFHSLEDRIVKRFFADRSDTGGGGSRHQPESAAREPGFCEVRKAIAADEQELGENQRARSARLRIAKRTEAKAAPANRDKLGIPGSKKPTRG